MISGFFFFKQKTAYEIMPSLVGSEMCIRDRHSRFRLKVNGVFVACSAAIAAASAPSRLHQPQADSFVVRCSAAGAAASAPSEMVSVCEGLIRDINERVAHIHAQAGLGADVAEVTAEQSRALLRTFSQISRIEIRDITRISNHLQSNDVWDNNQISAFLSLIHI